MSTRPYSPLDTITFPPERDTVGKPIGGKQAAGRVPRKGCAVGRGSLYVETYRFLPSTLTNDDKRREHRLASLGAKHEGDTVVDGVIVSAWRVPITQKWRDGTYHTHTETELRGILRSVGITCGIYYHEGASVAPFAIGSGVDCRAAKWKAARKVEAKTRKAMIRPILERDAFCQSVYDQSVWPSPDEDLPVEFRDVESQLSEKERRQLFIVAHLEHVRKRQDAANRKAVSSGLPRDEEFERWCIAEDVVLAWKFPALSTIERQRDAIR